MQEFMRDIQMLKYPALRHFQNTLIYGLDPDWICKADTAWRYEGALQTLD